MDDVAKIRVGVAGWDYRDWLGPVYPAGQAGRIDRLSFVARFVDVIEINSTFYRPVVDRVAASWVRRTTFRGAAFSFSAKTHRSWTHSPTPPSVDDIRATLDGLEPIRRAGKLSALLAQFPQSFRFTTDSRERLELLQERTCGWPLVVEVRHADWQSAPATDWFGRSGLSWCVVDQPRVGRSTTDGRARVTSPLAYLRLHGRNERDWFRPEAGRDERYNYLYSAAEIEQLAGRAWEMSRHAEELLVVQNNHFRGQALVNALQLKHLIEQEKPCAPQTLVESYPALRPVVTVERTGLF
jgi:uncharacterized protein YecE (DUF72 family)